ncbi:MAG: hypothetical protein A2136_04205 [Chloroflexi bacterium RBG_16_54_11]|nr:MAG: hypothetical protein A2136_04205 [Chloroflexi bacterium RBG_16_54_11]
MAICGADGCKKGWVAVYKDLGTGDVTWSLRRTANELVYSRPIPQVIALDIPSGLTEIGARGCDLEARRLLGQCRASSVFPAPIRPVLEAASYAEACHLRFQAECKKMSRQAWGITAKIKDVDEALRHDYSLQERVREVHPEVSFYFLAGERPMQDNKKGKAGRKERFRLLEPVFGRWLSRALEERSGLASAEDDVLDAFAALWTAERIVSGIARTIPKTPPADAFGPRMEITA